MNNSPPKVPLPISPPWRITIAMACLRIILRDESQTIVNSPLALLFSPTLNPLNTLPILEMWHGILQKSKTCSVNSRRLILFKILSLGDLRKSWIGKFIMWSRKAVLVTYRRKEFLQNNDFDKDSFVPRWNCKRYRVHHKSNPIYPFISKFRRNIL